MISLRYFEPRYTLYKGNPIWMTLQYFFNRKCILHLVIHSYNLWALRAIIVVSMLVSDSAYPHFICPFLEQRGVVRETPLTGLLTTSQQPLNLSELPSIYFKDFEDTSTFLAPSIIMHLPQSVRTSEHDIILECPTTCYSHAHANAPLMALCMPLD